MNVKDQLKDAFLTFFAFLIFITPVIATILAFAFVVALIKFLWGF